MKAYHNWLLSCFLAAGLLLGATRPAAADFIDLEDLVLPGPNSFVNNPSGTTVVGMPVSSTFTSRGAVFNNTFTNFGAFTAWEGWSYSNVRNVTTPGFVNQYAAYNLPGGGGDGSDNYAVAFTFSPGDARIELPAGQQPLSARITNTTFAALSMRDGDAFSRPFGFGDFFLLTIQGFDASNTLTGTVNFYLADFRSIDPSQRFIIDRWTTVNLTPLGNATRLSFALTGSDVGPFGLNTPAYFALDNLQVQGGGGPVVIPEPNTLSLAAIGAMMLLSRRKRRRG